jgi:hypothetical protein
MPFPFGSYVQYFQFGVASSERIADPHGSVDLKNPMLLTDTQWKLVNNAWSTQGDISYLDGSWVWGGMPYLGVSAQYYQNPLENPYEIIFFYNDQTVPSGTVLWQFENSYSSITSANSLSFSRSNSKVFSGCVLCFSIWMFMGLAYMNAHRKKQKCGRLQHSR